MAGAALPEGFAQEAARVGEISVNYVRGGSGEPLVLLHGYPQNWYMWRHVLPAFADRYTVIAPDLRGAGASSAPERGYDKRSMAADVHGLLGQLGLDRGIRLVGHDIGTMVGYAYAAAYPATVTRLVLTEAPIPDETIYQLPALTPRGPGAWNFGLFNVADGFAEQFVTGREELWVQRFMAAQAVRLERIEPEAVREYARPLRDPDHLRASFEYFRALAADVAHNAERGRDPLPMPVLALGAAGSLAQAVPDQVARYAADVRGDVVAGSGHWLFEERPDELSRRVLDFLGQSRAG
jgi:pimeloyl-ACP methyl ester carboxylesterase